MRAFRRSVPAVALLLFCVLFLKASISHLPTGTWATGNPLSVARTGATATLLPDGRVLIAGGKDAAGTPLVSVDLFNADGSVSAAPPMAFARYGHSAILLMDGYVLVAGGHTSGGGVTNTAELFDPLTNSWQTLPGAMTDARADFTMSQLQDGDVLLAGGDNGTIPVSSVDKFSLVANSFQYFGTLTTARKAHAAATLNDGRVIIAGGSGLAFDGTTVIALGTTEIYDPTSNSISAGPSLNLARFAHTATTLIDGTVLFSGGNDGTNDLASTEVYDPIAGTITLSSSSLAQARSGHTAVLLPNNNSVLIAGGQSAGTDLASTEIYQSWNNTFLPNTSMSTPRAGAVGSGLQTDGVALVGGGSNQSSTELYGFATVKTDQLDYPPGTTVNITGTGWVPGETVTLSLVESPLIDTHGPYTTVADANGNISNSDFITDLQDAGIRFRLTAVGSVSNLQAQNTFTDNKTLTVTFAGTGTGSVKITDTTNSSSKICTGNPCSDSTGNSDVGTVTATADSGSTFAGWSAQSSGVTGCAGNTCNFSMGNGNQSVTASFTAIPNVGSLTVSSQSGVLISGTPGSATYPITVNRAGGGSGAFSANLSVSGLPAGVSGSFSPNPIAFAAGDTSKTATLTLTSTADATATPGASFTVQAANVLTGTDSASSSGSITINKANTAFNGLTASQSIPYGQASINLSGKISGYDNMSGTVSITINGVTFGPFGVTGKPNNFSATIDTHAIPASASPYTIAYSYSGDSNSNASTDNSTTLTVNQVTPTVNWSAPAAITYGTALSGTQLNATFTASFNGGTVTVPGIPTYNPAAGTVLNAGTQSLSVNFVATDTIDYANASKTVQIVVNPAATTTAIGAPTVNFPNNATVTVTVSSTAGTPTGNATLVVDGGAPLTQPLNGSGVATFTLTNPSAGSHTLSAGYAAQGNFAASNAAESLQVNYPAPTLASISPTSGNLGQTLSVVLSGTNFFSSTSSVSFGADITVNSIAVDPGHLSITANITIPNNANVGAHNVSATNSAPGGGTVTLNNAFTVNNPATSTQLISSLNPSTYGSSVTFTATVTSAGGTPTGSVLFYDGGISCASPGTLLSTQGLISGQAGFSTTGLTGGSHTILVCYSPTGIFNSSFGSVMQQVNQAAPTVTFTGAPVSSIFGQQFNVSATTNASTTPTITASGACSISGTTVTMTSGVGTCSLGASWAADANYLAASLTQSTTAEPAPLVITITDPMPIYDGQPHQASIGVVPNVPLTVLYDGSSTFPPVAGVHTVSASSADANYTGSSIGTLTIQKAALTVTANDKSRAYGAANPNFDGTLTGVVAGDNITASYSSLATATSPVGTYPIVPALADPNNKLSNYTQTINNGALTITQIPLYIRANDNSLAFGLIGTQDAGAQYFGFVNGDTPASLQGALACPPLASAASPAGTYAIHCGGVISSNYNIIFVDGTLSITDPLTTITVSPNPASITYGDSQPFSAQGSFASSMVRTLANAGGHSQALHDLSIARSSAAAAEAGGKLYVIGGSTNSDPTPIADVEVYDPMTDQATVVAGSLMHARKQARAASVAGKIYVFGGCADSGCSSLVQAPEVYDPASNAWSSVNSSWTARRNMAVGVVDGKIYVAGGVDASGNAVNNIEIYDPGTDSWSTAPQELPTALGPATGGVVNGQFYVFGIDSGSVVVESFDGTNWKTVSTVPPAMSETSAALLNGVFYFFSGADVYTYDPLANSWSQKSSLNIARIQPDPVSIGSLIYVAGNAAASDSAANESFATDEVTWSSSDATVATVNQSGSAVSVKVGSTTIKGSSIQAPTIYGTSTLSVTPKSVTPTVTIQGKTYDGNTAATILTRTLSGVINNDDVQLSGGTAVFSDKNAGTGKTVTITGLTLTGANGGNYTLSSTTAAAQADIAARALHVTAIGVDKTYDGTTSATVTLSDDRVSGDSVTDGYTSASFGDKNVGTSKTVTVAGISISGADADNYTLANTTANATATIKARQLTVTAAGVDKVYDGGTGASVTLSDDRIAGDVLTDSYAAASFTDKNVGNAKAVSVSGISISGTDAGNYSLANTTASTTASINKRPITATAVTDSKTYDRNTTSTRTPQVTGGIVGTDVANFTQTFDTKDVGTAKTLTPSGSVNDGNSSLNYQITFVPDHTGEIKPKPVTPVISANNKVYDGGTAATLSSQSVTGVIAPDVVILTVTAANFADANAGIGKTVTATGLALTSADAANYQLSATSATTTANIDKATPILNWATPPDIVYGIPLSSTQLNATATGVSGPLAGTLTYTPGVGTVLNPGTAQTLNVSFAPSDTTNYNSPVSKSVTINVMYSTGACLGSPGHQILQPINVDNSSVFKQGSTTPAKFRVCDVNGNSVGTPGVVTGFRIVQTISGTVSSVDEAVDSTTPDAAFRWSPTDQQWIYNISTKSLSKNVTYVFLITLNDGSTIRFQYGLR